MLGIIIQGMKRIVTSVAKRATKVASFSVSKLSFGAKRSLVRFSKSMMSNIRSAKWWSKAARFVRKSGIVGTTGNVADALNKSGASNWLTKGLSAFKYDTRSPKEYQREYEYKTNLIESLKKKREKLILEADRVKDELNKPTLTIHNIPDVGDKINALSASIDQMKSGLAQVKVSQNKTNIMLSGMSEDISLGNDQLGEAVLRSSESNIKVALTNAEDLKNHNMALHQETSGNIVSEINSHIDEVERVRKEEEEEREKNDWKRKFFSNFLLIMEWILDFPGKIKMLLIKVGIMLTLALATLILKHWNRLMALFNAGIGAVGSMLLDMAVRNGKLLLAGLAKVLGLIQDGFRWVLDKLTAGIYSKLVPKIPYDQWVDKLMKSVSEDTSAIDSKMDGYVAKYASDQKAEKKNTEGSIEQAAGRLDPNKPEEKVNLDVVNSSEAKTKSKPKNKDKELNIPNAGDEAKPTLDLNNLGSILAAKNNTPNSGVWSTKASEMAVIAATPDIDYNRTTTDKAVTVYKEIKKSKSEEEITNGIKKIESLVLSTNSNVNNVNANVIKGTTKTMKAAASRPPITTINKMDMKKASPTLNPNGI